MIRQQVNRPDGAVVTATVYPNRSAANDAPLIFIPGWLCDARSWEPTARRLSAHRTCVTLDLPGFGASPAGTREDWSLPAFGADVAALAATLSGDRPILVGHSMGGIVALEAAIAAPDHASKVVAVDSFVYPAFYDPTPEDQIEPIVASFAMNFSAAITSAMQAYLLPASSAETRRAVEGMAKADAGHGLAVLRDFLRWNVDARLAATDIPVSIIVANAFVEPAAMARWNRFDLEGLDGVGHFIMLDDPERFDRSLLRAIANAAA